MGIIFGNNTPEDNIDVRADVLAMQFLGLVDQEMEDLDIYKKELALKIGTSASFIIQLFRGDRKPNWKTLARKSIVLRIEFKVVTDSK